MQMPCPSLPAHDVLRSQRTAQTQDAHATKGARKAQPPRKCDVQTLSQQLQTDHGHDACCHSKHAPIHLFSRLTRPVPIASPLRNPEPQRRHARTKRLRNSTKQGGPKHSFPSGIDGEVKGQSEREAFSDVVNEEGEKYGEAQAWVRVIGGVGDEALRDLMQCNSSAGLESNGKKCVSGDVVMMLSAVAVGGRCC